MAEIDGIQLKYGYANQTFKNASSNYSRQNLQTEVATEPINYLKYL